jgi:hypothetical protein
MVGSLAAGVTLRGNLQMGPGSGAPGILRRRLVARAELP